MKRASYKKHALQAHYRKIGAAAAYLGALISSNETVAQTASDNAANRAWQAGAIAHTQKMRMLFEKTSSQQPTPAIVPRYELDSNPSGMVQSYMPGGAILTSQNAFFQNLGTNGRTCFTCHQPRDGWATSAASAKARFYASNGADPIFRPVDGATCPNADLSTANARLKAYNLLISKGLIRVGLPMPAGAEFTVAGVNDPYNCNTNPVTGLTSPSSGIVSIYRRILPSANLGFLSAIMWDGREDSLSSQAVDATLGHAQAHTAPTAAQTSQIVGFETGVFTAQMIDKDGRSLDSYAARGGPRHLSHQPFYPGINDPFSPNFSAGIFKAFHPWENLLNGTQLSPHEQAIARGERVFNNTRFNISGVGGLNDALTLVVIPNSSCGTCHDAPNVGDHSVKLPLNIGISDAGTSRPPNLDISGLPVFTLKCISGPMAGKIYAVTDPGRALISGKCVDIGKFKGPVLRGLAARAPYFHNGSAATLLDVVNFYNARFSIGLTEQQKQDLAEFLGSL